MRKPICPHCGHLMSAKKFYQNSFRSLIICENCQTQLTWQRVSNWIFYFYFLIYNFLMFLSTFLQNKYDIPYLMDGVAITFIVSPMVLGYFYAPLEKNDALISTIDEIKAFAKIISRAMFFVFLTLFQWILTFKIVAKISKWILSA